MNSPQKIVATEILTGGDNNLDMTCYKVSAWRIKKPPIPWKYYNFSASATCEVGMLW